eukprot:359882-Chlamydomonas_euryale.AAC.4
MGVVGGGAGGHVRWRLGPSVRCHVAASDSGYGRLAMAGCMQLECLDCPLGGGLGGQCCEHMQITRTPPAALMPAPVEQLYKAEIDEPQLHTDHSSDARHSFSPAAALMPTTLLSVTMAPAGHPGVTYAIAVEALGQTQQPLPTNSGSDPTTPSHRQWVKPNHLFPPTVGQTQPPLPPTVSQTQPPFPTDSGSNPTTLPPTVSQIHQRLPVSLLLAMDSPPPTILCHSQSARPALLQAAHGKRDVWNSMC